jgi:hypothetical protein
MRICLLIACTLLGESCRQRVSPVSWNSKSGKFTWWRGEVTLPTGLKYRGEPSDSFAGHFTSLDGKLVIRHDIGGYAGAYASPRDGFHFEERVVDGVRVWTARRDRSRTTLFAVTFPDSGCANFFLESSRIEDAAIIDSIARSFRPKGRDEPGPSLCH